MKAKLTAKQSLFCREYLIDLNATQAAIRAKYSKKTARQIGADNLSKVVIQSELSRLNKNRFKKIENKGEKVIQELEALAHSSINDIAETKEYEEKDKDGKVTAIKKYTEIRPLDEMKNTGAISSIKQGKHGIEVKMWDKNKSLEALAKHHNLFKDNNEAFASKLKNETTEELERRLEALEK